MTASAQKSAAARKNAGTLKDFHEEAGLGRAYDAQLLARLWPFLRPHSRFLGVSVAMILGAAALGLVRPLMMGKVVSSAQDAAPDDLLKHGLLLSLVVVGTQALSFVQMYTMQIAGARTMTDLRAHIFDYADDLCPGLG